jgi:4-amino-4-deoxy-L-arabinose transferase-like glycosyltransferase
VTATRIHSNPVVTYHHAKPRAGRPVFIALVIGGLTLLIRLSLRVRGYDLYGDEVLYTDLGLSVISGGFPRYGGETFFLHGPGFFYLEAGWARLVGNQSDVIAWTYDMRALNALLAAATAVVLVLLGTRASSLRAGTVIGLLFALDPFCIRQNDRVLLETAMMFWVMLGYLTFTSLIGRPPSRRDWLYATGAGLLFGCAVLTKDEGALLTLLPLTATLLLRWGPRRGLTLLTVGTTVAVYGVYVAVVAANGQFGNLWEAKTFGVQRMLGLVQITGFHTKGGGNLSTRIAGEIGVFWTTYAALALAVVALIVILRRGDQLLRLLGLLYCAAGLTLGYAVVLGTLEEQELYLLIVPSLLIIPLAATLLRGMRQPREAFAAKRFPGVARTWIITSTLVVALAFNLASCVLFFRQPDDAFAQMFRYINIHIPPGTRIGAIDGDINSGYSLVNRYNVGYWETSAALQQEQVHYLVVEWGPIDQGYSDLTPSQVHRLVASYRLVVSFSGRTNGQVALYWSPLSRSLSKL